MQELVVNLHMHTTYSDGSGTHADLARAALKKGVDVLLVTDHNVWIDGKDAYHRHGNKTCLLLVCEEIHDQDRDPQKNHLLVLGAQKELSHLADNQQQLVDAVNASGGLCFIAHPVDPALPVFGEDDISWVDWDVSGYTGLEVWNGFSELKSVVKTKLDGLIYAFLPALIARGPLPQTLTIWDRLLAQGKKAVAIGGSDAHARHMTMGPLKKVIFPYEYHFSAVNTHVLVPNGFTGDLDLDRKNILDSLRQGNCFIGYDLPAQTRGFRFTAQHKNGTAQMGEEIACHGAVTLHARTPYLAKIVIKKDGKTIESKHSQSLTVTVDGPGVYRVEAYRQFLGRQRGWIFSNPIYIR